MVQAGAENGGIVDVPLSDIMSEPLLKGLPAQERNWNALPELPRPVVLEPGACNRKPRLSSSTPFCRLILFRLTVTLSIVPWSCEKLVPKASREG